MSGWDISENHFTSWDGTDLFYRAWKPRVDSDKALIFLHRGHEHSGRVAQQVSEFGMSDYWAFCWDCRGHGLSPGPRGYAEDYYHHVRDLDTFVRHITAEYGIAVDDMALVANSIGAVTAAAWVHDYAPRVRAMVLAAPGFRVRLYVPFAIPGLRLLNRFKERSFISSYVKSKMLTHDPEQMRMYDEDELITKNIAVNILLGLHDLSTRIVADAGAIVTPTLVLTAGSDWVVKNAAQLEFYKRLSSPVKEMEIYPGFFHAILFEKDRHKPIEKAREFLLQAFEHVVERSSLLNADRSGSTREEYLELRESAPLPKAIFYGLQKLGMRTLGRLSDGVRLGWNTGFSSGESLDYVYRNEINGRTPVGRLIDRTYLNAVGWKAMRERQQHLETRLRKTISTLLDEGKPVRIVDLAAGAGRYVLDILEDFKDSDISAVLRDRSLTALDVGRQQAAARGLDNVTFEEGDAFDTESIQAIEPQPNIAIVSGLYELFPDNQPILASLRGLAALLATGSYFIYTNQPWHPQIEEIARTCVHADGSPWVMRRRSQAEMDELVRSVGFDKTDMAIDSHAVSTVSVARRL